MPGLRHSRLLCLLLATLACSAMGEVVDRVIANVNGHVILQSDWEEAIAMEALLNGRQPDSLTSEERKGALDRLIDQELLREQVRPSESAPIEQVAARLTEIRKLHTEAATDQGWKDLLMRYGLTQAAVERRLADEFQLMRLVEARLRPAIQIDAKAVESYYQQQLLPELEKTGGKQVALAEVFGHIRDLLAEQRLNQLINSWLTSLRSESRIETRGPTAGDQAH